MIHRLTTLLRRCRFCARRQWRQPPFTHGVCAECHADTIAWLTEMGCVVTWPVRAQMVTSSFRSAIDAMHVRSFIDIPTNEKQWQA
jgi:hypothetical protein